MCYRAFQQRILLPNNSFASSGQVDKRKELLVILERFRRISLRARAWLIKETPKRIFFGARSAPEKFHLFDLKMQYFGRKTHFWAPKWGPKTTSTTHGNSQKFLRQVDSSGSPNNSFPSSGQVDKKNSFWTITFRAGRFWLIKGKILCWNTL